MGRQAFAAAWTSPATNFSGCLSLSIVFMLSKLEKLLGSVAKREPAILIVS